VGPSRPGGARTIGEAIAIVGAAAGVGGLGANGQLGAPGKGWGGTVVSTTSDQYDDFWGREDDETKIGIAVLPGVEEIPEDKLHEAEIGLKESIGQREKEQERYPRGSRNGSRQDREDWEQWNAHQGRIDEENELLDAVSGKIDELESEEEDNE